MTVSSRANRAEKLLRRFHHLSGPPAADASRRHQVGVGREPDAEAGELDQAEWLRQEVGLHEEEEGQVSMLLNLIFFVAPTLGQNKLERFSQ
jgi:hypothetical protein